MKILIYYILILLTMPAIDCKGRIIKADIKIDIENSESKLSHLFYMQKFLFVNKINTINQPIDNTMIYCSFVIDGINDNIIDVFDYLPP